ncbi:hypothetical protein Asppvi_007827 [Aspergillus pseudoviridinutans]|uniref:Uncharacterized protein n=1 Tax=Aspergillus pseudoviridinutans TaxID=1517512 RepID=A0A9P3EUU4_9EURO|nr:uncharacterized protein Asppvi_007827 [Aspergillus pseudoviridinutans]GIJ88899.1 hypothetical protein Asppvi_007827 [Aspergillus pseudoviridinutans]
MERTRETAARKLRIEHGFGPRTQPETESGLEIRAHSPRRPGGMSFLNNFEWNIWEPQGPVSVCPSSSEPTENGDGKPHGQVEDGRKWTGFMVLHSEACVLRPKSTTTEAALGRQLQECPFRETKGPSHGTVSKGNLQYSQTCEQEYSTAALVSFSMHLTEFTEYRLTMKRLATRIDARSRDSWPAVHGPFLVWLPEAVG